MRLLVATNELQGIRADDYAWTVEGELVVAESTVCADPRCGCARGFSGLASSRATTTAMVVDLPHIDPDALREAVRDYLERAGWQDLLADDDLDAIGEIVDEHVDTIDTICSAYAVGTVLERDGDEVRPRGFAAAA
jgi:hypothetical protein